MPVKKVIINRMKTKKDAASLASEIKKIIGEEATPRLKSNLVVSEELTGRMLIIQKQKRVLKGKTPC